MIVFCITNKVFLDCSSLILIPIYNCSSFFT